MCRASLSRGDSRRCGSSLGRLRCLPVGAGGNDLRRRLPPEGLDAERLLDIILWLDRQCRSGGAKVWKDSVSKLITLGHWLEGVAPRNIRFASPFGECIDFISRLQTSRESDRLIGLDEALDRVDGIWAMVRLGEFSNEIRPSLAVSELQNIRIAWDALTPQQKLEFSERSIWEPHGVIVSVMRFIDGSGGFFPSMLPFRGIGGKLPRLVPYLKRLDVLLAGIGVLEDLPWQFLGSADGLAAQLRQCVEREKERIMSRDASLSDPDSEESVASAKRAEGLLGTDVRQTSPGRIRPYELFRYAARRGWLGGLLTRDRPAPEQTKPAKP